jgi:cell division protein ZapE
MDLFYEAVQPGSKIRLHYHEFMQQVHRDIFRFRQNQNSGLIPGDSDPVQAVARTIAEQAGVLCLDEFQVKDITDAMLLGRLFEALMGFGCILVVTSNIRPRELYRNGLNRNLFEPFIDLIEKYFRVLELSGAVDYRLEKLSGETVYFCPLGPGASQRMKLMWRKVTGGDDGRPEGLAVGSRQVHVPFVARGAAWFSFSDLCDEALGAKDYLAIAKAYEVVFIEGVRELSKDEGDAARRFINLIDTLYDNKTLLVISADAPPEDIYKFADTPVEFARTVSRLQEMQSADWWKQHGSQAAKTKHLEVV